MKDPLVGKEILIRAVAGPVSVHYLYYTRYGRGIQYVIHIRNSQLQAAADSQGTEGVCYLLIRASKFHSM